MSRLLLAVAALGLPGAVHAETVYVTDMLRLGIHQASDASDQPFDNLLSGAAVELLERNGGYARVRMADGREGWVKSAFLVRDKPARLVLEEAQAETTSLQQRLAQAETARAKAEQDLSAFKQRTLADTNSSAALRKSLAGTRKENEALETRLERYRHSLPLSWVLAALPLTLVAGFVGGWWWLDASIRRRHGGFRIY